MRTQQSWMETQSFMLDLHHQGNWWVTSAAASLPSFIGYSVAYRERESLIDNLLVRIHFVIEMIG